MTDYLEASTQVARTYQRQMADLLMAYELIP